MPFLLRAAVRGTHCTQPICSTCIIFTSRLLSCVCPKTCAWSAHLVTGVAALLLAGPRPIAGTAVSVIAPVQQVLVLLWPYLHTGSQACASNVLHSRISPALRTEPQQT